MKKLDPRLRMLVEQASQERSHFAESLQLLGFERGERDEPDEVDVLVRIGAPFAQELSSAPVYDGEMARTAGPTELRRRIELNCRELGLRVRTVTSGPDPVVVAAVNPDGLERLVAAEWIEGVESSQPLYPELDLSGEEIDVRSLQAVPPDVRGAGVLVGVIDGGIDFHHLDFRRADGTSRIQFLWLQGAPMAPGGRTPYGREFTKAQIDAALRASPPPVPIAHADTLGHGTHVAGIAAGNGNRSAGEFVGMAPDSELIVVVPRSDGVTLGASASTIDACQYMADRAAELNRPIAINMSLGNNGGGHSGESPLETAMDGLARRPGVVLVKSAGNEQQVRIHARAQVAAGAVERRQFESGGNNLLQDLIEIWFDGADVISVALQPPGGPAPIATDFVSPGDSKMFTTSAGNRLRIDALSTDAENTGDVRVLLAIESGLAPRIQPGRWTVHLRGDSIVRGDVHLWIERTARGPGVSEQSRFTSADYDPTVTISVPGTARRVITVGAYVTRFSGGAGLNELSQFSSHGPSRYGLRKPEIAAPGENIAGPLSRHVAGPVHKPGYTLMAGTSMAAPHVTGVAALMLQVRPTLTCDQVKQLLARSARRTGSAASAPDDAWGAGRLDAARAVDAARSAVFPIVSNVQVTGTELSWDTDVPTTGAVRFNTHARRLRLGLATGSRSDLTPATSHRIDLADLPAGRYHCEIQAFTPAPDDLATLDDNDGALYVVDVP